MISFQQISKIYPPDAMVLDDINLEIKKGEFVSLVGQSGAGKTTLIRLLIREELPSQGKILLNKKNIINLKYQDLPKLRQRIGMVFQDIKLLPRKTAFENVAFAMEVADRDYQDIQDEVPELLKIVGLAKKADALPRQLSGGEQQRVAMARALAHQPDILIADEPTGNLDLLSTWDILKLLLKINDFGTTVILATHNKDVVNNLKKRVVTMDKGRIIRDKKKGKYLL